MSARTFSDRPLAERIRMLTEFERNIGAAIKRRQYDGLPTDCDERELADVRALLTVCRRESRFITYTRRQEARERNG